MNKPDELAGLPEDVRDAAARWDAVATKFGPESSGSQDWAIIRAGLLRLAHGHKTALAAWRDAEEELSALKRRIEEAPTALVQRLEGVGGINPDPIVLSTSSIILNGDLIGQRVALLPVGDEV